MNDEPRAIQAYIDALRQALDPADAERLLTEIHEHLLESVAAELERGLTPAAAEARAIERFGPPDQLARQYAIDLAEAAWQKRARTFGVLALGPAIVCLYYLRFFLTVRQETATLVQIVILLLAALVLVLPARFTPGSPAWPVRWPLDSIRSLATVLVALVLAATVFAWADQDSHSVSDTLNRSVPTLCLIVAIAMRALTSGPQRRRSA